MVYVAEGARIVGDVAFGEASSVWYNAVIRGDDNPIRIGSNVNIQDNCTIHAGHCDPVSIGDFVTIGHGAIIHGCTIESECLIGMGSIIMDRAIIHSHCVVAAGSLIPEGKEFPSGSLIMGSPAKAVRTLTEAEIKGILDSARYYSACACEQLTETV